MATQSRPPSKQIQKRISQRGAITDADIQEYIDEVGLANLSNMSMNDVAQFLKSYIELGQKKKKLPRKKKIESADSIVVADQQDQLVKVSLEDQKKSSSDTGLGIEEDDPSNRPLRDKLAAFGVSSVKKISPTLGKLIDLFQSKDAKQKREIETVNQSNRDNAQQVSRSSLLLTKIVDTQLKTNELLEKIVAAAATQPIETPRAALGDGAPNIGVDLDRRRTTAAPSPATTAATPQQSRTPSAGRVAAYAAGAAVVAGGAYAAYRGISGGSESSVATQIRPESGRYNSSGAGGNISATYSRTAEGRHTIDDKEVDAETYNRFRQLTTLSRPAESDPRYQRYLQEAAAKDEFSPGEVSGMSRMEARRRIQDEDRRELMALLQRVRTQSAGQTSPAGQPASTLQTAAAGQQAQRQETSPTGAGIDARILNIKAKEIIFKADNYEFDRPTAVPGASAGGAPAAVSSAPSGGSSGGAAAGSPPPAVSSGGSGGSSGGAAAAGGSEQIQTVVQKITQEFPAVNVTSTLRPGSGGSQHATGNAADLSLRGLSQDQRASLVQNLTSGKYGNVGGLGTYNAAGDLLHVDTRSGAKMAWGPNRSRSSLNETPQWFQQAVSAWMGGEAAAAGGGEQEPRSGGEQTPAATLAPSEPASGAAVSQASIQSETAMMQSQQAPTTVQGATDPAPPPSGSMEQTATAIDPNEPGSVEPPDAAQRYARLFNMAA